MASQLNDKMPMIDPHPLLNVLMGRGTHWVSSQNSQRYRTQNTVPGTEGLQEIQILDVIACLSISKPRRQVAAVSLTLSKNQRDIVICLAQNGGVPDHTTYFLEELWGYLKELWLWDRTMNGTALLPPSPDDSKNLGIATDRVYYFCYAHCVQRLRNTIKKRWGDFLVFKHIWETNTNGPEEHRSQFRNIARALEGVRELLGDDSSKILRVPDLMEVADLLKGTLKDSRLLFQNSRQLEKWASECKQNNGSEFPLHRYLTKCYVLESSVQDLLVFILAQQEWIVRRNLMVRTIRPESGHLSMSTINWKKYITHAFDTAGIIENPGSDILKKEADKASALASLMRSRRQTPIHCEVLLLAYHHRRIYDALETPPLSHFGCSKAACRTCGLYFQAYRHCLDLPHFFMDNIAPSRQPRDVPWIAPELDDTWSEDQVNARMYEILCTLYGRYLERAREVSLRDSQHADSLHYIQRILRTD